MAGKGCSEREYEEERDDGKYGKETYCGAGYWIWIGVVGDDGGAWEEEKQAETFFSRTR